MIVVLILIWNLFRKTFWQIDELDGRGGEGGDLVAADAGQTQLLGRGQREPPAHPGHQHQTRSQVNTRRHTWTDPCENVIN